MGDKTLIGKSSHLRECGVGQGKEREEKETGCALAFILSSARKAYFGWLGGAGGALPGDGAVD